MKRLEPRSPIVIKSWDSKSREYRTRFVQCFHRVSHTRHQAAEKQSGWFARAVEKLWKRAA